ncbi:MAG: hypothetical protein Q8K30_04600 [Candidatus Gracilibacteria bacterium]|nr:hypothetical protein [Candidatus Gracilibacteria bacterium]
MNNNNTNKEIIYSELEKRVKSIQTETSFRISNCEELIIQEYKHSNDDNVNKEFIIKDSEIINSLSSLLNKLPEDGEEFRSFIPTISYKRLIFICKDNKNYQIEFYGDKIKTPGTTFFSNNSEEGEKLIVQIINKLIKDN